MNREQIRRLLLAWYAANRRSLPWRDTDDPYHVWVSETMLQQTRVDTVVPYYHRFLGRFPAPADLAAARLQDVLKAWEGLGYYARARNLHKAAGIVVKKHNGRVPDAKASMLALPGVGPYIGAAVLSIAYGRPLAVVDGNVKRVLARLHASGIPVNTQRDRAHYQSLADDLLDRDRPGTFNQAVMELGAMVCRPKAPQCDRCPLTAFCAACAQNLAGRLPVVQRRAAVPSYRMAAGAVCKKGRVLIVRRPENGLLGGLWEFPAGVAEPFETAGQACRRVLEQTVGLRARVTASLARVKHAYTHFRVEAEILLCDYESGRVRLDGFADFCWVAAGDLGRYPLTGLSRKFLPLLLEALE